MSGTYIEWIPVFGQPPVRLHLNEADPYLISEPSGLLTFESEVTLQDAPGWAGQRAVGVVNNVRVAGGAVTVVADTDEELAVRSKRLTEAFYAPVTHPGSRPTPGRLRVYRDGQIPLETDAYPRFCRESSKPWDTWQTFEVEWVCPHPFWREVNERIVFLEQGGGLTLPTTLPAYSPAKNVRATVENPSAVEAPITLQIFGVTSAPYLMNETTGEIIQVKGDLAADEYIEIRTGWERVSVELVNVTAGSRVPALNRIDFTAPGHRFWKLVPGSNVVFFNAGTIGAGGRAKFVWSVHKVAA